MNYNELTQNIKNSFERKGIQLSKIQLIWVYHAVKELVDLACVLKTSTTEQQAIDILVGMTKNGI
jgi:hypothetical protein